jgi:hypothetical protein
VLLTDDGQHYQNTGINNGRAVVVVFDTNLLAGNPGGELEW